MTRSLPQTLTTAVPTRLQLDGWWLDHDMRPFPKRIVPVKVTSNTKRGALV
jgi:hypothetical protein